MQEQQPRLGLGGRHWRHGDDVVDAKDDGWAPVERVTPGAADCAELSAGKGRCRWVPRREERYVGGIKVFRFWVR